MGVPISFAEAVTAPAGTGTTLVPTIPSHQEDDVLIFQAGWKGNQAPTTLTGWTLYFSQATGTATNGCGQGVWWRRVAPAETVTSPTLTIGTTAVERRGIVYCIRGADIDNPSNTFWQKQQTVGNSASPTPPGITTLAPNYLLLHLVTCRGNSAITPPTGYNEEQDSAEGTTICVEGSTKTQTTAATVSGQAASISSNRWVAAIIAIPSPDYPYFRSQTSATATATNITPALPTGTTSADFYGRKDLLILTAEAPGDTPTLNTPADWTEIWSTTTSGGATNVKKWYALYDGSIDTRVNRAGSGEISVQLCTYRNSHQTTPIGNVNVRQNASSTTSTWDALTRSSTKSTVNASCVADATPSYTSPAGWTERSDGNGISTADQIFEAGGSTASASFTLSTASPTAVGLVEILSHAGVAGSADLPLTFSDNVSNLADSINRIGGQLKSFSDSVSNLTDAVALAVEYRTSLSDDADTLTDSEAHIFGVTSSISDALAILADEQAQQLDYLLSPADSFAANWNDALELLLAHLLATADAYTLSDATTLYLEQHEQFSDSLALLDAPTLTLGYELPLADSASTLNDTIALTLTYHLTLGDNSDAFPSTPSLDDFNRANEDPATGWTQVFTSAANIRVLSNQASGPLSGQTAYSIFTSLTPGDEQEVYVDISAGQVSGGGLGNHAYLLLRFTGQTSDSASGYLIDAFATFVRVHRVDALGSFTTLSTQDTGIQLTAGDKFGARMRGDVLEVWVDDGTGWSLISTVADATYPSGKIGIGIHSVDNDLLLDNFGGGTAVGGLRDAFTQQLVIVDSGVLSLGLSDALNSLTESLVLGYGLIFAEDAANLSDALDVNIDQRPTLTDAIALSDNVSIELHYQLSLDDLLSLTDSNDLVLTYLQTFSDVIILSDDEAAQLAQLAQFADSVSLADSATLLLAHLLALSDDANLLIDAIDTSAPQGPLREVGVTDSIDTLSDAVVLQLEFRLSLADAVSLADSHLLAIGQHLALSDNAANWVDFLAFTYGFGLILDDNAATLIDAHTALLTHALQVADTFTLTDSLVAFGENYLQVDDSLTLADDVNVELRGPDREVVVVDVLVLTDAISLSLGGEFQYQIVLTDAITLYDHYFDLRHPYIPSTRRHIVVPSRARTTRVPAGDRETVPAGSRTTKVP